MYYLGLYFFDHFKLGTEKVPKINYKFNCFVSSHLNSRREVTDTTSFLNLAKIIFDANVISKQITFEIAEPLDGLAIPKVIFLK